VLCLLPLTLVLAAAPDWQALAPGVEYRRIALISSPDVGDGQLDVVRIDVKVAHLDLALASEHGGTLHTAAEWADDGKYVAVINAGMYEKDISSNVGHLHHGAHVNQKAWKSTYQSVLAFSTKQKGVPAATMLDRDAPDFEARVAKYDSVVQNLRLIRAPGEGVWKPNGRRWSEALVALDDQGRLLFIFSRTPFEMSELTTRLLAAGLGVVRAMHVEGGPEASLSIRSKALTLDRAGSYETGFFPYDSNDAQWRIPNVIGVR
jgi:hypothetical protein